MEQRRRGTHGWAEVSRERKRELIEAISSGRATKGPVHAELDLTDRCNIACYFCNQQDTRTSSQIPLERATKLIDELADTGLRSVRLSGGGDPLFHREILDVLDHLAERNVVVDNVTTNAVALSDDVAKRLVANEAREVIVSLNTVDAEDYHRMMKVKPALFDKVVENVKHLVEVRGDKPSPSIVIQFLLDRENLERVVDMYDLACSMHPDRIAINAVLEIPRERIDRERLLRPEDRDLARPYLEELLRRDKDAKLLQIDFAIHGWNEMALEVRERVGYEPANLYPTAPSFRDHNGDCFFAWYTTTVTGNGNLHPCCLLINPDLQPLGNIMSSSFAEQWNGPAFREMRREMRDVLLSPEPVDWDPERFKRIQRPCVETNLCWLKNMYFRGDDEFYRDLGAALDVAREADGQRARARALKKKFFGFIERHPGLRGSWDWFRNRTRPLRIWVSRRTGLGLTEQL